MVAAADIGTEGRRRGAYDDGPRLSNTLALISLAVLAASYVVNAMDRQVFSVLLPGIRHDFGFDLGQGGLLATIFTLGIGVAGVPTGYLLDRVSRKSVIIVGIVIYSVFTFLTAVAVGFPDMMAYRALSGVGEAMQNGALFSAVGAYFFARRSVAIGTLNFAYGLGGFIGPQLGTKIAGGNSGWKTPFYTYGLIGLVFAVIVALVIRKSFTERKEVVVEEGPRLRVAHLPDALYNRNVLLLMLAAVAVGISMYGYIGLYPTFLEDHLGFGSGQASLAASMFGLGAVLGIPAGWLGDRLNQRAVMIVAALAGCVIGYLLFNGPTTAGPQYALSFGEGAIASGFLFVNIYSALQRSVKPRLIGRVSGLFVASFYLPAAFAGYLFSALVDHAGWGGAGLWQLTVLPLVAVAALLFVRTDALARTVRGPGADTA
ncbi:MFS transporter [Streptomyces sp. NPDC050560]|uniref:MFS transporter n=1 Tax=Streptomyces sp. NPDC050560 TaxID=3365630 RepID=UPI0037B22DA9